MNPSNHIIISLLYCIPIYGFAQDKDPGFRHPMDLPIEVAGNFMELRTNHFHSGLDMKTNGRTGQAVKAVADGWVSRIKISPWGYGNAVYLDHPSGYTTVYGHLDRLNGKLASTLLDLQYAKHSFSIDQYFKRGAIPVSKGEIIAFSGNTGGSTAPHLHFEVRRSADQHALDPQAYGMRVPDRVPPVITGIRFYPLDSLSRVSPYPSRAVGFIVRAKNDSTYVLKPGTNAAAFGTVGLAVNVTDKYSNSHNTCGIRSLAMSVDGQQAMDIHLDEVDFATKRYANAYMDYGLFKKRNMHYNRCYKLPNNKLKVYGKEAAQGRIATVPGKNHAIQVIATDAAGNRSTLTFVLHGATEGEAATWPDPAPAGPLYRYDQSHVIHEGGMRFELPAKALYQNEHLFTSVSPPPAHALSPLYHIQDELTPLQKRGTLSIAVTGDFPAAQASKLLIVRMSHRRARAEGGSYANGTVSTRTRTLGAYTVMMDTIPPTVSPIDLRAKMKGQSSFRIRVRDKLSGIAGWTGKIDGKWILLSYEPKTATLKHIFDKHTDAPGTHEFELEVHDERGNTARITRNFTR